MHLILQRARRKTLRGDWATAGTKLCGAFQGGLPVKIEKLEPSQHRQGRWLVWLEDGSLVRLGEGDVVSLGLYSGKELTEAEGEALAAPAAPLREVADGRAL